MPVAIKVNNLSKCYLIGHQKQENYRTLRDVITHKLRSVVQRVRHPLSPNEETIQTEEFWALQNVNLEIKQGDRVGIIGRNGAGKSTLLKLLSRITEPTTGSILLKGRVASLLEVGTGFHPELTGKENIFLNGAILGMSKREIKSRFDEIVTFAEVENFLDTPVKRYSSGMYVRLAFAVAAHLEPEILIVDEVLAVGDAKFQKKCIGKMRHAGQEGRTILFVSHNMAAIEKLCKTGIVLDNGNIGFKGKISEAVKFYIDAISDLVDNSSIEVRADRRGEKRVKITNFKIQDYEKTEKISFTTGRKFLFKIDYKSEDILKYPRVIIGIYDYMDIGVARFDSELTGNLHSVCPSSGRIICSTENLPLSPGRYFVNIALLSNGIIQDYLAGAAYFDIHNSDYFNTGKIFDENDLRLTKMILQHQWSISS